MVFNNYQIPENITAEDEFMYNLMDKLYWAGSHYGFVMGAFTGLIEHMKENKVSDKLIKEAEDVFNSVDTHLKEYNTEIYNFSCERWKELGKPLSLLAHQAKKKRLDAEDDYKDKYCDR